ncbi:hypothetical protein DV737_g5270, partial [Chaetothyriales sp. CBS 132003]
MRASLFRLAQPTSAPLSLKPNSSRSQPISILPPIPLYRALLRLHRRALTPEERVFGDTYLKSEFHRHKSIENPLHIVGFLTEWTKYGQMVADKMNAAAARKRELQAGASGTEEQVEDLTGPGQKNEVLGRDDKGGGWARGQGEWSMEYLVDKMSDQQVGQVHELWEAIRERARESVDKEDLVRQAQAAELDDVDKGKP